MRQARVLPPSLGANAFGPCPGLENCPFLGLWLWCESSCCR